MDGIHDLGGKHGYGPITREPDEPAFHARWEAAVFAMVSAARPAAYNNTDRFRHAIERIDPVAYLSHTYYGRWLGGIENLLVEAGVVTSDQITERAQRLGASKYDLIAARPAPHPDPHAEVAGLPTAARELSREPQFRTGDQVVTSTEVKAQHTRLPSYARGKRGLIRYCHAGWVYPDSNAHGGGEVPQFLYSVEFTGPELWGKNSDTTLRVYLDLFEPYLERGEQP